MSVSVFAAIIAFDLFSQDFELFVCQDSDFFTPVCCHTKAAQTHLFQVTCSSTDMHLPGDMQQKGQHGFPGKPPCRGSRRLSTLGCHHLTERCVLDRLVWNAPQKRLQGKEPALYYLMDLQEKHGENIWCNT